MPYLVRKCRLAVRYALEVNDEQLPGNRGKPGSAGKALCSPSATNNSVWTKIRQRAAGGWGAGKGSGGPGEGPVVN